MIKKIFLLIDPKQRINFFWLCILFVFFGFIEVLGVGSVIPFINSLSYENIEESDQLTRFLYSFFEPDSYQNFIMITGTLVTSLILLSNLTRSAVQYFTQYYVWSNQAILAIKLFEMILSRPYSYFVNKNSADSLKDVLTETEFFVTGLLQPLLMIISNSIVAVSIFLLICFYNLTMGISVFFVLSLVFGTFMVAIHKPLTNKGNSRMMATTDRFKIVDETLSGIKYIKFLNEEEYFTKLFKRPSYQAAYGRAFQGFTRSLPRNIFEIVAFASIVIIVLIGISKGMDLEGVLPLVTLFAFAGYRLLPSVSQIYTAINSLTFNTIVLDKLYSQVFEQNNESTNSRAIKKKNEGSKIEIKNLSFRYPLTDQDTLKDINLTIDKKNFVGLIGSTGSGKSTFIDILLGLYTPSKGEVVLSGVPIQDYDKKFLSSLIGYVPQHIYLSDDSIRNNIALGQINIDDERVKKACTIAEINDFISKELDQNYNANTGQRGVKLSGGQVQRIGIARALYNNPEILILDEGTSNLDQQTEAKVIQNILNDSEVRLIIMIGHRIKAFEKTDSIIVFDKGSVQDQGSYDDMIKTNSIMMQMENS